MGLMLAVVFVLGFTLLGLVPLTAWLERKQLALAQGRAGANRAAVSGLTFAGAFQPLADLLKLAGKERRPAPEGSPWLNRLAPVAVAVAPLVAFAVVPYGSEYEFGETTLRGVVADVEGGVLWVLALGLVGAWGVVLGGWSSRDEWAQLGALREAARTIACSLVAVLSLVPLFMIYRTLRPSEMAAAQDAMLPVGGLVAWLGGPPLPEALARLGLPAWGLFLQPLSFLLFFRCGLAATRRAPFDLSASGTELAGGVRARSSGMGLGLLQIAELLQVALLAALIVTVFLGGWSLPFLAQATLIDAVARLFGPEVATALCMVAHLVSFFAKVVGVIALQIAVRARLPRQRADVLTSLAWRFWLPLALANIALTAAAITLAGGLS